MDAVLVNALVALGAACVTAAGAVVVALVQRERRAAAKAEPRETALPPAPPSTPLRSDVRTETDAWREAMDGRVTALERNDRRAARLMGRLEIELARLAGQGGHGGRDSDG